MYYSIYNKHIILRLQSGIWPYSTHVQYFHSPMAHEKTTFVQYMAIFYSRPWNNIYIYMYYSISSSKLFLLTMITFRNPLSRTIFAEKTPAKPKRCIQSSLLLNGMNMIWVGKDFSQRYQKQLNIE